MEYRKRRPCLEVFHLGKGKEGLPGKQHSMGWVRAFFGLTLEVKMIISNNNNNCILSVRFWPLRATTLLPLELPFIFSECVCKLSVRLPTSLP